MTETSILPASSIDRRLIRAAAKYATPRELSEAVLGQLTPEQAQARVLEILDSKTILDEIQERRILLVQMAEHLAWMREQKYNEKSWTAISQMFKIVSDQVERSNISLTDVSTKLAADQARMFVDGYVMGFEAVLKNLKARDIEIEDEAVLELVQVGADASAAYVDTVTQKLEIEQ